MPEVVASGETGYVVDSVEQAVEAVANLASIDRRVCRQRAERLFSVDRMVEDYLAVYEQVR